MRPLAECRVVVIGLGLMGGSLAAALRGCWRAVVGVGRNEASLRTALRRGLIDEGFADADAALRDADLVVLATPVRTIVSLLSAISDRLPQGCVVMDLGSTKEEILRAMETLPEGVEPLGAHPMCGKETSGVDEADPALSFERGAAER